MDEKFKQDPFILFRIGAHEPAIRMEMDDFLPLAKPCLVKFSYHMQQPMDTRIVKDD